MVISTEQTPWFANFDNHLALGILPHGLSSYQNKKFLYDIRSYFWEEPLLFKLCKDGIYRRCHPEEEVQSMISRCHDSPSGGHDSASKTTTNVLQTGFFWPFLFKDVPIDVRSCDHCQRMGN